jgi:N-acetylglucosaminyldiphosphoundecaprenol N-acetyl-beta-D-mannosaminyltransferase
MLLMKKASIMDFQLSTGAYTDYSDNIIALANKRNSSYVCVANVHMLIESARDDAFQSVVGNADIITPDGKPLTWVLRLLHGIKQERVAGMDLLPDLLMRAELTNLPVLFYGGTSEMIARTESYIRRRFPSLIVAGLLSPPFRELSVEEEEETIRQINSSGAKLVFVVLGCPKQEKWMARMKGRINAVMVGIGGALPVMVGIQKRAPTWMQHAGLEWFFRLCQEPRRLFRRYAITNTWFMWLTAKEYFKLRILRKKIPILK